MVPSAGEGCSNDGGVGNILANWSLGRLLGASETLVWPCLSFVKVESGSSDIGFTEPGGVGTTPFYKNREKLVKVTRICKKKKGNKLTPSVSSLELSNMLSRSSMEGWRPSLVNKLPLSSSFC